MNFSISLLASILVSSLATASAESPFFSRVIDTRSVKKASASSILSSDFSKSDTPDIVTASTAGPIRWYKRATGSSEYDSYMIGNLTGTTHMLAMDVNGDGYDDIVVTRPFDGCPNRCHVRQQGYLQWLENPKGKFSAETAESWKVHDMLKTEAPGHRLVTVTDSENEKWIVSVPLPNLFSDSKGRYARKSSVITAYNVFNLPANGQYSVSERFVTGRYTHHDCHDAKTVFWDKKSWVLVACDEGAFMYSPSIYDGGRVSWDAKTILPRLDDPFHRYRGATSIAVSSYGGIAFFQGNTLGYFSQDTNRTLATLKKSGHVRHMKIAHFHGKSKPEKVVAAIKTNHPGLHMFSVTGKKHIKFYSGDVGAMIIDDFDNDGYPDLATISSNSSSVVIHYTNPNYSA